jgi:hypothetical protein
MSKFKPQYRIKSGVLYLNNSGSKWIVIEEYYKITITLKTVSGKDIVRTPLYFYSFGNFAGAIISYKGKKIRVLMDTVLPG